jgi:membrane-bound lytic murein transglycosylase D
MFNRLFLVLVSLSFVFMACSAKTNDYSAIDRTYDVDSREMSNNKSNDEIEQTIAQDDDLAVSVSNQTDALIAKSLKTAPQNEKSKKALYAATLAYQNMNEALKRTDIDNAKKYFDNYLREIAKAEIAPGLLFYISDDLGNLIDNLNEIYSVNSMTSSKYKQFPPIPLTLEDNSLVDRYIDIYSNGDPKERIKAAIERSGAYRDMIMKTLNDFGLPPELFYLPVVESLYSVGDVSRAGAVGLWQIMPSRGRALGLKINYWIDERRDPEKSTIAACIYLKQLFLMLNNWHLALAAYNRGEYGLIRDMKFSNASNITSMVKRKAIPRETQNYVPQFIAAVKIGRNLNKYGFNNINYRPTLKYDKVKINKVLDLKVAAECAEITLDELKALNPALRAWSTPQGYPDFELKIPYGSKEIFLNNLAKVKELNPAPEYIRYRVEKGDYLGKIAKTFNTTEAAIIADNPQLQSKKYIQPNQILMIRPRKQL